MSKIRADKIEYQDANFVVTVAQTQDVSRANEEIAQEELVQNRMQSLIEEANKNAQEIIQNAQIKAQEILDNAQKQADEILSNVQVESEQSAQEIIQNAQEEIENKRIEQAKIGYEEGHKDGQEKIQEELEEKIKAVDDFCLVQFELKNKILKSLKNDIIGIISRVSKKVIQKELDFETLENVIKKTIFLLEKKENINVILSEKYANLFLEIQNKSLGEDKEFSLNELKNYENFNISCNPKIAEDTIIVENLKERFDASINSQIDVIVNEIYESFKNEELDLVSEELKNEVE